MTKRIRLGLVGTGWITGLHLASLARLDRTDLVGVVSGSLDRAASVAASWGGTPYTDLRRMLERERPDAVYVCLPPHRAAAACELLVGERMPFLTEKPLAASAADAQRVGVALRSANLVAAVGYNWRGLDFLPVVRERLADRPARMVLGRWTGRLPPPAWWRHVTESGGQVVEQATHLYDAARFLVGEAVVVAASSARAPRPGLSDADVDSVAAAVLRFEGGAIGSFVNASILGSDQIELDLLSDGRRTTIRMHPGPAGPRWTLTLDEGADGGGGERTIETRRDPYDVQAEAFLDALARGDRDHVLSSYEDALVTDGLVRSVVSATGSRG
jgi:myo-inositol 2-dehydrogenase/D-chiro-inositol 1-dehydrogenase